MPVFRGRGHIWYKNLGPVRLAIKRRNFMREYYFLFPFREVAPDSKIVIVGATSAGNEYQQQLNASKYCTNLAFIDKRAGIAVDNFPEIRMIGVHPYSFLNELEVDKIVLACCNLNEDVYRELVGNGIPSAKIIKEDYRIIRPKSAFGVNPISLTPEGWNNYYQAAESNAKKDFERYLLPMLKEHNLGPFASVLDFACGQGRIASFMIEWTKQLTCCDVNPGAIEVCRERFSSTKRASDFHFVTNGASDLGELNPLPFEDARFDFIYSWDAMVHFDYKWLDFYLWDFYRVLKKGGHVLIHHSNYGNIASSKKRSNNFRDNPGWRTLVTKEDICFIAQKHGFQVYNQTVIDWTLTDLDCITLLKKEGRSKKKPSAAIIPKP